MVDGRTKPQSDNKTLEKVKEEIADTQIYLARLADHGIDPITAANELIKNADKYPGKSKRISKKIYGLINNRLVMRLISRITGS